MTPERIISGGQTGADRAALDAALACGLPIGGWCPRGRRAEDGQIPARYPLVETPSRDYRQRTRWNVRDSDFTLVFVIGSLGGGSKFTTEVAERMGKLRNGVSATRAQHHEHRLFDQRHRGD